MIYFRDSRKKVQFPPGLPCQDQVLEAAGLDPQEENNDLKFLKMPHQWNLQTLAEKWDKMVKTVQGSREKTVEEKARCALHSWQEKAKASIDRLLDRGPFSNIAEDSKVVPRNFGIEDDTLEKIQGMWQKKGDSFGVFLCNSFDPDFQWHGRVSGANTRDALHLWYTR